MIVDETNACDLIAYLHTVFVERDFGATGGV
jgi:hypothetical protein